jgi:hypothetical protein
MSNLPISEIVKNSEWQKIRKSLLNKWKNNPEECCEILRQYLGDIKEADIDKLRILNNYLYSSGFRIGIIKHICIDKLRAEISAEMKKRKFKK